MTRRTINLNNNVADIKSAALSYKRNLVGRTFLYVFDNRFIEVIYKAVSFKHLTGVDSNLGARSFYKNSVKQTLSASNLSFNSDHPFSLCVRKVSHINDLANLALGECFMLEDISTNTHSYKFGTTDMEFTLLFDEDRDDLGNLRSEKYVVVSLRDEDCFDKASNVYSITHILSKPNDAKLYDTIIHKDDNYKGKLPDCVADKLSNELKNRL